MATAANEIKDRESFEEWLRSRRALLPEQQFRQEVVVLASRCALRVLPFILESLAADDDEASTALLEALRANAISWVAASSLDQQIEQAAKAAAEADMDTAGTHYANMHAGASFANDAVAATGYVAFCAVHAVVGLVEFQDNADYMDAAEVVANERSIYNALSEDAQLLEQSIIIAKRKLWQQEPGWWSQANNDFQKRLQLSFLVAYGYDIWSRWYKDIAEGLALFGIVNSNIRVRLERNIALGSTDGTFNAKFWTREATEINADVRRWAREAQAEDGALEASFSRDDTQPLTEDSFEPRPATLATTVSDNRVVLLDQTPDSALTAEDTEALMTDIARGLRNLARNAEQADRAVVEFLNAVADRVESAPLDKVALFESGRGFETLQKLAPTIDAEWNALLSAQYHALMLQFARALNKFSAWRDAMREHRSPLVPVEREQVVQVVHDVATELQTFAGLVSPEVSDRLHQLANAFKQQTAQLDAAARLNAQLEEAAQQHAQLFLEDVAYSLANVLTSATQIVWSYTGKHFLDGVREQLPETSKELGKKLVKWVMGPGTILVVLEAAFPRLLTTVRSALEAAKRFLG
jgi:hypothetical protein